MKEGTTTMEIFKRMAQASKAICAIQKGDLNKAQGWKYRGIDAIYNGIHDAMAEAEIFSTTEILRVIREKEIVSAKGGVGWHIVLEIKYTFHAPDGSNVSEIVYGEATDWGDKCINKCMAIAHKYALMQVFTIPTEDLVDPDTQAPEVKKEPDKKSPLKCLNEAKKPANPVDAIVDHFKKLDVTAEQIETYLGKPLDNTITDHDKMKLRALADQIKNGVFIVQDGVFVDQSLGAQ